MDLEVGRFAGNVKYQDTFGSISSHNMGYTYYAGHSSTLRAVAATAAWAREG